MPLVFVPQTNSVCCCLAVFFPVAIIETELKTALPNTALLHLNRHAKRLARYVVVLRILSLPWLAFETGSHLVLQVALESVVMFPAVPHGCWDYRHRTPFFPCYRIFQR